MLVTPRRPSELEQGDALVRRLVAREGDPDTDANELLKCFFRGYPLENLRELLTSTDPEVAKSGAWIASELGVRAKPLIEDVIPILGSPIPYARFFAIDSVLTCADWDDGGAVAAVIRLIDDSDGGVRWKAVQFLIRASAKQLQSASPNLDGDFSTGLQCLLGGEGIESMLRSPSATLRRIAFAAAVRGASTSRRPLEVAAESDDDEIRSWAGEEVEKLG